MGARQPCLNWCHIPSSKRQQEAADYVRPRDPETGRERDESKREKRRRCYWQGGRGGGGGVVPPFPSAWLLFLGFSEWDVVQRKASECECNRVKNTHGSRPCYL